jgi:hypothetical protein
MARYALVPQTHAWERLTLGDKVFPQPGITAWVYYPGNPLRSQQLNVNERGTYSVQLEFHWSAVGDSRSFNWGHQPWGETYCVI